MNSRYLKLYYRQIVIIKGTKIKQYGEYIYSYKNYALNSLKSALYRIFREVPLAQFPKNSELPEVEVVYRFFEKDLTLQEYEDFKKAQKRYARQSPYHYFDHYPNVKLKGEETYLNEKGEAIED